MRKSCGAALSIRITAWAPVSTHALLAAHPLSQLQYFVANFYQGYLAYRLQLRTARGVKLHTGCTPVDLARGLGKVTRCEKCFIASMADSG
jgi:hypothetical protein